MSCISFVRRFISTLPDNQVFTTRECLIFGKRANVDKALQKLVKTEVIIHLAWGVFVRRQGAKDFPSILEIAMIKAKAFGKEIRIHGTDTAAGVRLGPQTNAHPTFYVDGSSSSFVYRGTRIHLKKCSKKMMTMTDSKAGLAIRALWSLGKATVNDWHINMISHFWHSNNEERKKIMLSKAWMPAWLGDRFVPTGYLGPQPNWSFSGHYVRSDTPQSYRPFNDPGSSDQIRPS